MVGRNITLSEIRAIVDQGDMEEIKSVITRLTYEDMENIPGKRAAFDYIVKHTSGLVRVEAFFRARWYWDKSLFEENLALVKSRSERLKIIAYSAYSTSYPEDFIEAWETKRLWRFLLINTISNDDRNEVLQKVDESILLCIDSTILDSANDVRAAYALSQWADPDILHVMKEDKFREVITNLSWNPALKSETAKFLIEAHKTPSIRMSIAARTDDIDVLKMILNSTKSKQIHEAVFNNPHFK